MKEMVDLLDEYLVRDKNGGVYAGGSVDQFIKEWLTPVPSKVRVSDPILGIQNGTSFRIPKDIQPVYDYFQIGSLSLTDLFLSDLQKWPTNFYFGLPNNLLRGYGSAIDKKKYLRAITGHDRFLNHTEALFYLLHGYGRPNKYISPTDAELRDLYIDKCPTAYIVLSDLFGFCPGKQNPDAVKERLSSISLESIDTYHQNLFVRLHDCNLEPVLISLGILPRMVYNEQTQVWESNISQIGLYRSVIPNRIWDRAAVIDRSNLDIELYLNTLPDLQLLLIPVEPDFRSVMIRTTLRKLTQVTVNMSDPVRIGREVDSQPRMYPRNQFIENILTQNQLVDPTGSPFSPDQLVGPQEKLRPVLDSLSQRISEYPQIYQSISSGQRAMVRKMFRVVQKSFDEPDFQLLLSKLDPETLQLPFWSNETILNGSFQEYLQGQFQVTHKTILDTIDVYLNIL